MEKVRISNRELVNITEKEKSDFQKQKPTMQLKHNQKHDVNFTTNLYNVLWQLMHEKKVKTFFTNYQPIKERFDIIFKS